VPVDEGTSRCSGGDAASMSSAISGEASTIPEAPKSRCRSLSIRRSAALSSLKIELRSVSPRNSFYGSFQRLHETGHGVSSPEELGLAPSSHRGKARERRRRIFRNRKGAALHINGPSANRFAVSLSRRSIPLASHLCRNLIHDSV
jgi:hypothetical protein